MADLPAISSDERVKFRECFRCTRSTISEVRVCHYFWRWTGRTAIGRQPLSPNEVLSHTFAIAVGTSFRAVQTQTLTLK